MIKAFKPFHIVQSRIPEERFQSFILHNLEKLAEPKIQTTCTFNILCFREQYRQFFKQWVKAGVPKLCPPGAPVTACNGRLNTRLRSHKILCAISPQWTGRRGWQRPRSPKGCGKLGNHWVMVSNRQTFWLGSHTCALSLSHTHTYTHSAYMIIAVHHSRYSRTTNCSVTSGTASPTAWIFLQPDLNFCLAWQQEKQMFFLKDLFSDIPTESPCHHFLSKRL